MPKLKGYGAAVPHLPSITEEEVRSRFSHTAEIHDPSGFVAQLHRLLLEGIGRSVPVQAIGHRVVLTPPHVSKYQGHGYVRVDASHSHWKVHANPISISERFSSQQPLSGNFSAATWTPIAGSSVLDVCKDEAWMVGRLVVWDTGSKPSSTPESHAPQQRRPKPVAAQVRQALMLEVQSGVAQAIVPFAPEFRSLAKAASTDRMKEEAAQFRAETPWTPSPADIERGRASQIATFNQSHNLPLKKFVELAHKSRQQIYKDIQARKLLALQIDRRRGLRLPDWQLESGPQQRLTVAVLQGAADVGAWTLYRALTDPLEGLSGRSPLKAAAEGLEDRARRAVFNVLGIHDAPEPGEGSGAP